MCTHASDLWFVVWGCDRPKKGGGGGGLGGTNSSGLSTTVTASTSGLIHPASLTTSHFKLSISPVTYYQYLENDVHWESRMSLWLCFNPNLRPSVQTPSLFCGFFSDDRGGRIDYQCPLFKSGYFLKRLMKDEEFSIGWRSMVLTGDLCDLKGYSTVTFACVN